MIFLSTTEQAISNYEYWNFLLSVLNIIIAAFSAWCAYEANQSKKETQKIENNITTNIQNAVKVAVKAEIQNSVSATASASVTTIINNDDAIKRISSAVANELIAQKTPKFTFKDGTLNISLPDESNSLKFERK